MREDFREVPVHQIHLVRAHSVFQSKIKNSFRNFYSETIICKADVHRAL